MLLQFVTNASILMLCIFGYYFAQLQLRAVHGTAVQWNRLRTGAVFGIAGALLVATSVHIEETVLIDLRAIAIMLASLIGGLPSGLIAAFLVAVARLWQGGLHYAPLVGVTWAVLTALGCSWIRDKVPPNKAFYIALGYTFTISIISFAMVVEDNSTLIKIWMYYSLTSLPTAWVCYQLVIHLGRINELYERTQFNEERYRLLFHSVHDIVFLAAVSEGKPRRFLDVNDTACRILGYAREELLQLSPESLYDPKYLHKLGEISRVLNEKGQYTFDWGLKAQDGRLLPVEISGRVFELHGETVLLAVVRDIALRKEAEQKLLEANRMLEKLSVSDGLTGIANRRGFDWYYRSCWVQALRQSKPLSVLIMDIDCFKLYNDHYGHLAGDHCLKQVAGVMNRLAEGCGGYAARYGGEEFAVILPGANRQQALRHGESIRRAVEELAIPHETSIVCPVVTVSVGAASLCWVDGSMEPEEFLAAADRALYMAKHAGRNRVTAWEGAGIEESVSAAEE